MNIHPNAVAPQIAEFPTGGFVVHKLYVAYHRSKFSACFDRDAGLVDAEAINAKGQSRNVRRGSTAWNALAQCGLRLRSQLTQRSVAARPINPAVG